VMPPNRRYDCIYAKKQITVKTRYGLRVEAAEKSALRRAGVRLRLTAVDRLGWRDPAQR
jgi:hypothetical protein